MVSSRSRRTSSISRGEHHVASKPFVHRKCFDESVCTDQFIPGTCYYLASWMRIRKWTKLKARPFGRVDIFFSWVTTWKFVFFFELEYLSTTGEKNFTSFVKKSMRFHGRLENTSKEKIPEWKRGLKFVMQRFSLERFPFCRAMTREDRKLHAERRITLSIIRVVNRRWPHFWPHREILESTTSMTGVIGDRLTLGSLSFSRRTGARLSVELCIRPYRKSSCR